MKRIFLVILFFVIAFGFLWANGRQQQEDQTLVIYTYDSFVSDWGPAPVLVPMFEEEYGIKVDIRSAGDAGQVLQKLYFEKDNPVADLVIGIDNNMLSEAVRLGVLEKSGLSVDNLVSEDLAFDREGWLVPYDYGYFSIIYDSSVISDPPLSLEDLTDEKYEKSLILMDPRTSSPGLGFLLWTVAVYGDGFAEYWERLMPSVLTITDGWSSGYGLFTSGEAPMVLSYTTSPAYHVEYEETDRYKAIIFPEGHYIQIEGMGIIRGSKNRDKARLFMEFMLSREAQEVIPLTNWMYPVVSDADLPDSFDSAPKASLDLMLDGAEISARLEEWFESWLEKAAN